MTTLRLEQTANYYENLDKGENMNPCVRCGKEVKNTKFLVHFIEGGNTMLAVADEDQYIEDDADMGFFPVGSECARHIPKEFLHKVK